MAQPVNTLVYDPSQDRMLCSLDDGLVRVFHYENMPKRATKPAGDKRKSRRFTETVKLNPKEQKKIQDLDVEADYEYDIGVVEGCCYATDGESSAFGGRDGKVNLFSSQGNNQWGLVPVSLDSWIYALCYDPIDGSVVASCA